MDTVVVLGNMAWNAGLVAVAGYMVKQWMTKIENRTDANAVNIAQQTETTQKNLAQFTATTVKELKDSIKENRVEANSRADTIIQSIDKLADHIAVANGRTSKLEGKLAMQLKLCDERRRSGDKCYYYMGEERRKEVDDDDV